MAETRNVDELKAARTRHRTLPQALITRIELLCSTLNEVYPQSIAEWLDGFQRDTNPEREIAWWERLARCYMEYSSTHPLNPDQRRAAFNLMLKLMLGATNASIATEIAILPDSAGNDIGEAIKRLSN